MTLYSLSEANNYICKTAEKFAEKDLIIQEEKRRRLEGNQIEITRCNTEELTEIITKVMQFLQQYPQILQDQQKPLTEIKKQIKDISSTYETPEFKLFSKLLDHSKIGISVKDNKDSYPVN